jgi:hypothetical protein
METDERITLPLSHEERRGLKREVSRVTLTITERPSTYKGPGRMKTHEQWVAEVDAAIGEYRSAGNRIRAFLAEV